MRMGLHTDSNRIENMFVYFFSFSILSRHPRGIRPFVGIQRIYLTYRFDSILCGIGCLSPSYIASLPPIPLVVSFIFNGQSWTIDSPTVFDSNIGKWNT
jgi:hypothetical protein